MKKNLIILLVTFFVSFVGFSQNVAGVYKTDYREMTLQQTGNRVTGTYEGGNGKIDAILTGNKLEGTWSNSGSNKSGKFEFIFNSDFSAFTGKYGYNNATPSKRWNGTKIKSSNVKVVNTEVETILNNVAGVYKTDYREMTLQQNGNRVTGTYEGGNGKIDAILTGNKLVGTWSNSGSNKTGKFEFIFNSDFSAFTGKYGYSNATPSKRWNGTKISSNSSTIKTTTQEALPINVYGSWAHRGARDEDDRLNIWQEGNRFVIVISWIDINTKIWKSYKGEGYFEGRQMNFKVFPSVLNGKTIDLGYMYHYTISSDNNVITGYYTKNGKRNPDVNWHYQRVTENM
ncbi:hypothetical protein [Lutibacter sp.]|uniref:hypothetical protein n=1 Tax=Lutibacter sp. TaxID=1925666 RepID=UPI00356603FC